jgi:hypothetical protein
VTAQHRIGVVDDSTLGDTELLANEINTGNFLSNRVLDLQAGVDLEEGDRSVDSDEEFAGAGVVVAGLLEDGLR